MKYLLLTQLLIITLLWLEYLRSFILNFSYEFEHQGKLGAIQP